MSGNKALTLQTYAQWRHCIEVDCGIALEPAYIAERLRVWRQTEHEETQRFAKLYGKEHPQNVIHWFEQAQGSR